MKRLTLFVFILWILLALPSAFVGIIANNNHFYPYEGKSSLPTHSLPTELKFCGIFPLDYTRGVERLDGFLMAIDEINSQDGSDRILPPDVSIKPLVVNDHDNSIAALDAANYCIENNVSIVIGSSRSHNSKTIAEELAPLKIVQISYASSDPELSDRDLYPYFMRVVKSDMSIIKATCNLIDSFHWKNGSLLASNNELYPDFAEIFLSEFSGTINEFAVFDSEMDEELKVLQSIANTQNEFIILMTNSIDAQNIFEKANDFGLISNSAIAWILMTNEFPPLTVPSPDENLDLMKNVIKIASGNLEGPLYSEFVAKWKETSTCGLNLEGGPVSCGSAISSNPNPYSAPAYDSVFIAAKGFATASQDNPDFNGTDSDVLLNYLYNVSHTGAGDNYNFNEYGEVDGSINFYSLMGDTYFLIGKWDGEITFSANSIILPGNAIWNVTNNMLVCSKNCVNIQSIKSPPNLFTQQLLVLGALLLTFIVLALILFIQKSKSKNFSEWLESNRLSNLRSLYHKVLIGLDNAQTALLREIELEGLETIPESSSLSTTVVENIFPPEYRQELKSAIRGRTVLILIEIAFQPLENSHRNFLSKSLNIPRTTVFNEITQLISLKYIEPVLNSSTLKDTRYKHYSLTSKGVLFLYLLKETINITILQMKKNINQF